MSLRQNRPAGIDRLQALNDPSDSFKNPAQLSFMRVLIDILRRVSDELMSTATANPHVLLSSPDGTVYRVTVSDAGELTVVNARG